MLEFEHGGHLYRSRPIDTFTQFDILARCGPIIGPWFSIGAGADDPDSARNILLQINAFMEAIRKMTDDERHFVLRNALGTLQRRQTNGSTEVWADVHKSGRFMFQDIDNLSDMLQLSARVLRELFTGFLSIQAGDQAGSTEPARPTLVSNG